MVSFDAIGGNAMREYFRLVQPLHVVRLTGTDEGETITLPIGAMVEIAGSSRVPGCVHLLWEGISYNAFEEDLRDRSTPQRDRAVSRGASGGALS
jgi:hypothetical protein